jgi:hypothetical protein
VLPREPQTSPQHIGHSRQLDAMVCLHRLPPLGLSTVLTVALGPLVAALVGVHSMCASCLLFRSARSISARK